LLPSELWFDPELEEEVVATLDTAELSLLLLAEIPELDWTVFAAAGAFTFAFCVELLGDGDDARACFDGAAFALALAASTGVAGAPKWTAPSITFEISRGTTEVFVCSADAALAACEAGSVRLPSGTFWPDSFWMFSAITEADWGPFDAALSAPSPLASAPIAVAASLLGIAPSPATLFAFNAIAGSRAGGTLGVICCMASFGLLP
jgi:hypothetical protein